MFDHTHPHSSPKSTSPPDKHPSFVLVFLKKKQPRESILYFSLVQGCPLGYGLSYQKPNLKKINLFSPRSHQLSIAPQWQGPINPFLFHARVVIALIVGRSCSGNPSCWEVLSKVVQSCPEDIGLLWYYPTSAPCNISNTFLYNGP